LKWPLSELHYRLLTKLANESLYHHVIVSKKGGCTLPTTFANHLTQILSGFKWFFLKCCLRIELVVSIIGIIPLIISNFDDKLSGSCVRGGFSGFRGGFSLILDWNTVLLWGQQFTNYLAWWKGLTIGILNYCNKQIVKTQ
jgi:hypothetical protein